METSKTKKSVTQTKFERVYEDEQTISIWKYDLKISTSGPIEVEIKYKKGYVHPLDKKKKTLGELAKEARKESKLKKFKS
jgi:hypothetical protein